MEKSQLIEVLNIVPHRFRKNELAFLALTSKIENHLRDKIAFVLHENFKDELIISREWNDRNGKKADIAIFNNDPNINFNRQYNIDYLIEFKAQAVPIFQKSFTNKFYDDLIKMANAAEDKTLGYFILFNNIIEGNLEENLSNPALKYLIKTKSFTDKKKSESNQSIKAGIEENWKNYLKIKHLPYGKSEMVELIAGKYNNLKVTIVTFVYGPLNSKDLKKLEH